MCLKLRAKKHTHEPELAKLKFPFPHRAAAAAVSRGISLNWHTQWDAASLRRVQPHSLDNQKICAAMRLQETSCLFH